MPPAVYCRQLLKAILLAAFVGGTSCSPVGGGEPVHDQAVVATGPHCVEGDPGRGCRAAMVVSNESELGEALALWGYAPGEVGFSGDTLVLVGVDESSTCPARVDNVVVADGVLRLTIGTAGSDDCTSDAGHRSFIIGAGAGPVDEVVVNGAEVPLLSL